MQPDQQQQCQTSEFLRLLLPCITAVETSGVDEFRVGGWWVVTG